MRRAIQLTSVLISRTEDRTTLALPVAAFAIVSALTLTIAGGARHFFGIPGDLAQTYRGLAIVAVILLVVPLLTLCGAAARLSTRRRDDRLATLRLLGAPRALITRVTVLESVALALAGALLGVLAHLALAPLVGLLSFHGERLGAGGVLLGPVGTVLCVLALVLLATASAFAGLRGVAVSPLGVRIRQDAPAMTRWRVAGFVVALVLGLGAVQILNGSEGDLAMVVLLSVAFGLTMAVLNLVGPFVVRVDARWRLRRLRASPVAPRLLAVRAVGTPPRTRGARSAGWR